MSGGGQQSQTKQTIAPELRPLFKQTGETIMPLQSQIAGQYPEFFSEQAQQIPGLTSGQQDIMAFQRGRAFGDPMTSPESMALQQIDYLTGGPMGSSPATIAAMNAVRNPVLNDLALAGLGNSDAVGSNLAAAYAPILAQEQAMRAGVIPQLTNLGNTLSQRQSGLLSEYGASEEQGRGIEEARGQAALADLLRRQGLGSEFTTGILGGFPSITGSKTSSSGGGGMTVICTELHRQRLLDDETLDADIVFGKSLPVEVLEGYRFLATPIAEKMAESPRLTRIIALIALSWAREMKRRVTGRGRGSWLGAFLLWAGVPICAWIGRKLQRVKCYG